MYHRTSDVKENLHLLKIAGIVSEFSYKDW